MKKSKRKAIPIYIILVFVCFIALFPFVWVAFAATHNNSQIFDLSYTFVLGESFLANLATLKKDFPVARNIFNTLAVAGIYTAIVILVDSMAGYAFDKFEFKGKKPIFMLFMVSLFVPVQVTMIPLFVEVTNMKLMNTIWAVILPSCASVFGVFLMRQNMAVFSGEIIGAARIDGAGEFYIFFKIVFPNMRSAITALGIVSFVNMYGSFMWPLIALRDRENYTLPLALSLLVQPSSMVDYGEVFCGAIITLLPMLILFLAFQKNFVDGMTAGALKG